MSFGKSNRWGFKKDQAKEQSATQPEKEILAPSTPDTAVPASGPADDKIPTPTFADGEQDDAKKEDVATAKPEAAPKPAPPVKKEKKKPEVDPHQDLKIKVHRRLIEEIDLKALEGQNSEKLIPQIREAVSHLLMEEDTLLTSSERERLCEEIVNETMGLGPLEQLLADDDITEIMINGPKTIFIEKKGQITLSEVTFKDNMHLMQIIDRIVSAVGRRVDETSPLCDARLKDGSRFNAVIPPLALDGPTVTIRKFRADPFKVQDLINFGSMSPEAAELLRGFVEAHLNIVISGGTGSGKTTLLNVLSSFIPDGDRIITVEDTAELQLQQRHVVRLETRPANLEGRGEISMRDLVKNALRMRPERIVVGECRSGETLDMLQAMNTGHDGSLTTLHANTPRDAVRRIETMVMMAGYDLPQRAIREQISSAVHVIVQASRLSDGSRRVMNITEVVGMEGDVILLQDVFIFKQHGVDEEGKVIGEFTPTGVRPKFLEKLMASGVNIDASMFEL